VQWNPQAPKCSPVAFAILFPCALRGGGWRAWGRRRGIPCQPRRRVAATRQHGSSALALFASVARSAGLHPLRISVYARAAGSRDTFIVSVSHQYFVDLAMELDPGSILGRQGGKG
jgi:hypothetical protein